MAALKADHFVVRLLGASTVAEIFDTSIFIRRVVPAFFPCLRVWIRRRLRISALAAAITIHLISLSCLPLMGPGLVSPMPTPPGKLRIQAMASVEEPLHYPHASHHTPLRRQVSSPFLFLLPI